MIKPNDKVATIKNEKLRTGKVKTVYDVLNMAIVVFDDGTTEKVPLNNLAVLEEPKPESPKEEFEEEFKEAFKITNKSELSVTITIDEMRNLLVKVTDPDYVMKLLDKKADEDTESNITLMCMSSLIIGDHFIDNLYEGYEVITLTKDEFDTALKNAIMPHEIQKYADMSISDLMPISIASIPILKQMKFELWPDD